MLDDATEKVRTPSQWRGAVAPLFRGFSSGPLKSRNRVAMAPMTRERASKGVPTEAMAAYYERRAAGGVGLVITEGSAPDAVGAFGGSVPRFYGEDVRAGWRQVVNRVHGCGAAILAQLWHVGAFEPSLIGMTDSLRSLVRISPSGMAGPGRPYGRAMTPRDIDLTIDAFAAAAVAAQQASFDGIELHAAHGYLIDQFLWGSTNIRTDIYGRDRARFAADLVREVRRRVGPDFAIGFRFSQWKQLDYDARIAVTPDELSALLMPLAAAGVDLFHCSTRRYWEPAFAGDSRTLSAWTKQITGKPVMAVGSVTLSNEFKSKMGKIRADVVPQEVIRVAEALDRGDFDLIALGRALLANPDWAHKVETGQVDQLRPFSKEMLDQLI